MNGAYKYLKQDKSRNGGLLSFSNKLFYESPRQPF